ncbi:MAG TPA: SH3 domain-containing protein [Steroidobacteraceae bacterium]
MQRLPSVCCLLIVLLLATPGPCGAREYLQVFVVVPYLEMHTGPGRGYPVFNVVDRDQSVDVLVRYTEWFKVRTERGLVGWVSEDDMVRTVLADGSPFTFNRGDRAGFTSHRYEMGLFAGSYGGATLISTYGSWSFNSQLAAELAVGQFLGNVSTGATVDLGLAHVFLPDWRFSPFVTLGTGLVHTEPKTTLVQPVNRTEQTAYVGGGVRYYLSRRFFLRAEYKSHVVFTKLNSNEVVDEWKVGFAFFY